MAHMAGSGRCRTCGRLYQHVGGRPQCATCIGFSLTPASSQTSMAKRPSRNLLPNIREELTDSIPQQSNQASGTTPRPSNPASGAVPRPVKPASGTVPRPRTSLLSTSTPRAVTTSTNRNTFTTGSAGTGGVTLRPSQLESLWWDQPSNWGRDWWRHTPVKEVDSTTAESEQEFTPPPPRRDARNAAEERRVLRPQRSENDDLRRQMDELTRLVAQLATTQASNVMQHNTPRAAVPTRGVRYDSEELPRFDGTDLEVWLRFETAYMYLVRIGADEDVLLNCFNRSLHGEPLKLVEHLLIVRANSWDIMEELRGLYGDPKKNITRMTRAVLTSPMIMGPNDPNLRELGIKVKRLVTNIKHCGYNSELDSVFTQNGILQKLTDDQVDKWLEQVERHPNSNLEDLADFIMTRVRRATIRQQENPSKRTTGDSKRGKTTTQTRALNVHDLCEPSADESGEDDPVDIAAHFAANRNGVCGLCHSPQHVLPECVLFLVKNVTERYDIVRTKNLCSCCLSSDQHPWRECPVKKRCTLAWCKNFHHPLLHQMVAPLREAPWMTGNYSATTQAAPNATPPAVVTSMPPTDTPSVCPTGPPAEPNATRTHRLQLPQPGGPPASVAQINAHFGGESIFYGVTQIQIKAAGGKWKNIYAMVDSGAGATLLDKSVQEELGLSGPTMNMGLRWSDGTLRVEQASIRLDLTIRRNNSEKILYLKDVRTVTDLRLPVQSQDAEALQSTFPHLAGIPLSSFHEVRPQLLIGVRHAALLVGDRVRRGGFEDPVALKSPLGWMVLGVQPPTDRVFTGTVNVNYDYDHQLDRAMDQFFRSEEDGTRPPDKALQSKDEQRAHEIVQQTLKRVNDRYEIGLFWRQDDVTLPDSYRMALSRLQGLERSLKKRPELMRWVDERIQYLLASGHARKATYEDLTTDWPRVWYLPIFVVTNPNKPKPRLVCDAAATVQDVSLNSVQVPGPNLLVPLAAPIFRIRQYAVATTGDVRDMFPQIRIREPDQQCQRFLWRSGDQTREPDVYVHQGMIFGSCSSPFGAQVVKNTHADTYALSHPEAVDAIKHGTFVDDYCDSRPTLEEAVRITNDAIAILGEVNLNLVNFQSNVPELLQRIPSSNVVGHKNLDLSSSKPDHVTKVLGLKWDTTDDQLFFAIDVSKIADDVVRGVEATKRQMLSTLMRFFDPLGLLSHFHLQGRLIMQDVWRHKIGWDEPLPDHEQQRLARWVRQLSTEVTHLRFARRYSSFDPAKTRVTLHVFGDASEQAMAATAYLRFECNSKVEVTQVMARVKTMPLKALSIPQAELVAAVIAVRLAATVRDQHTMHITSTTFWTDSTCVLSQLSTRNKLKPFFAVRTNEILATSSLAQWRHVPTAMNPADYGTKWHADGLVRSNIWFNGPSFLRDPEATWPPRLLPEEVPVNVLVPIVEPQPPSFALLREIRASRADNWIKLVRIVAWRLRFVLTHIMRKPVMESWLTPTEMRKAEEMLYAFIQTQAFPVEYHILKDGDQIGKSSNLWKLSPQMGIDNVIRLESRLQNAPSSYSARNPAILPNRHPLVAKLVLFYHELHDHIGEDQIIAALRSRVWIINIRSAVRRVASMCAHCVKERAKPRPQRMANLPDCRVNPSDYPFEHTGADVGGPFEVAVGRSIVKRWVIIFTCMTTRAVFLEMLYDMSADEILQVLGEFERTRGKPRHLYTDCGTNFRGATNIYCRDLIQLQSELGSGVAHRYQIWWHFNPPYSPHFGGVWERLIACVKRGLNALLDLKSRPSERIFRRAIKVVEGRLNARPLTLNPINPEDREPLTPNHFLLGHGNELGSPYNATERDQVSSFGYRRVEYLSQKIYRRWLKEYLPTLAPRSRWLEENPPPKVGEVVEWIRPGADRDNYLVATIQKLIPGKDGRIRVAVIRTADGKEHTVTTANVARLIFTPSEEADSPTGGGDVIDPQRDEFPNTE